MTWINKYWKPFLAGMLFIAGTLVIADGLAIYLKAKLAQVLIKQAWSETLVSDGDVKPWPWADTWPVARLQVADTDLYILQGAQGSSLAFGPGWMEDSVRPEEIGTKLIAGHRDTHFKFLQDLQSNDALTLTGRDGRQTDYYVDSIQIIDSSKEQLLIDTQPEQLVLITCYPFDAIEASGPQRYIVNALPDKTFSL